MAPTIKSLCRAASIKCAFNTAAYTNTHLSNATKAQLAMLTAGKGIKPLKTLNIKI